MIKYKSGYKYQLIETYNVRLKIKPSKLIVSEYITLSKSGNLTIEKDYCWDGASGPAIDTKNFMRGSLVHDALYQLMCEGYISKKWRKQADKELRRICLEDGMSKVRVSWVYWAVRTFAKRHSSIVKPKETLTAP